MYFIFLRERGKQKFAVQPPYTGFRSQEDAMPTALLLNTNNAGATVMVKYVDLVE